MALDGHLTHGRLELVDVAFLPNTRSRCLTSEDQTANR